MSVLGWEGDVSPEHLADLMDAVHNIPEPGGNWERCDVRYLREVFLSACQDKWAGRGGLVLCDIFDAVVANGDAARPVADL